MNPHVQIIATAGPTSGTPDVLSRMVEAGMDVLRSNMSHGTYEQHAAYIKNAREIAARAGKRIPIILDLSGPREATADGHEFDTSKEILTEKDLRDLDFAIAQNADYIAQSYVGSANDVALLKSHIAKRGAAIPVIAKIERVAAVKDIDNVIAVADAIMVARGDLGLSEPIEEIPYIERDIIRRTKAAGKPVITATQMLYSMVDNPAPTRAEVTDVAFAVMCGSDVVMLSDETARGKYPVESVAAMKRIAARAEREVDVEKLKSLK